MNEYTQQPEDERPEQPEPAAQRPVPRHRDAATGEYVTEEYAKANPSTTVREVR